MAVDRDADRDLHVRELRAALESRDGVEMLWAATDRARRAHIPHDVPRVACGARWQRSGCDGLCALAVAETLHTVVAYYERLLAKGRIGRLANPGGWARRLAAQRAIDVCQRLASGGGTQNLPRAVQGRFSHLPPLDRALLEAAMWFARQGTAPTDWPAVAEHAAKRARGLGYAVDDGTAAQRLQAVVAETTQGGGANAAFLERELLAPLAKRRARSLHGETPDVGCNAVGVPWHLIDEHARATEDAICLAAILDKLDRALPTGVSWEEADGGQKAAALRAALGPRDDLLEIRAIVDALDAECWVASGPGSPSALAG